MTQRRVSKLQEQIGNSPAVLCAAFSPETTEGRHFLATGGTDHRVLVCTVRDTIQRQVPLVGHQSAVTAVAFGPPKTNPGLVIGGTIAGELRVWDLPQSQEKKAFVGQGGHKGEVTAVETHPFGEFFVTASEDGNLKVWDLRKKTCLQTYKNLEGKKSGVPRIDAVRFSPDGRMVASGNADGSLCIWDLTAGKRRNRIVHHRAGVTSLDFHPQELIIAGGCAGGVVSYWDMENWNLLGQSCHTPREPVRKMVFSPCGNALLSTTDSGLDVWDWPSNGVNCECKLRDRIPFDWKVVGAVAAVQDAKQELYVASFAANPPPSSVSVYSVHLSSVAPFSDAAEPAGRREPSGNVVGIPVRTPASNPDEAYPPPSGVAKSAEWPPQNEGGREQVPPVLAKRNSSTPNTRQPAADPQKPFAPRFDAFSPGAPAPDNRKAVANRIAGMSALPSSEGPSALEIARTAHRSPPPAAQPPAAGPLVPVVPSMPVGVCTPDAREARGPVSVAEEAVQAVRKGLDEGPVVQGILLSRLTHLSVVNSLWAEDSSKPLASEHLSANSDPTLWADIMNQLPQAQVKRQLTAPVCSPLLEMAAALLSERYLDWVQAAVRGVRVMYSILQGPLTRALQGRTDDVIRAEHHRVCHVRLKDCRDRIRVLHERPGITAELRAECSSLLQELKRLPAV